VHRVNAVDLRKEEVVVNNAHLLEAHRTLIFIQKAHKQVPVYEVGVSGVNYIPPLVLLSYVQYSLKSFHKYPEILRTRRRGTETQAMQK
jgi:hypothetical protein